MIGNVSDGLKRSVEDGHVGVCELGFDVFLRDGGGLEVEWDPADVVGVREWERKGSVCFCCCFSNSVFGKF